MLAALVLAVLALVGGAPAAGAALPAALNSLASIAAYAPKAPAPTPQTDRTAHPGGPHQDLRRTRPAPSPTGPGTGGRNARDQRPGPSHSHIRPAPSHPHLRTSPAQPRAQALHERSPVADPSHQAPRAGIGRAHLIGHAPPPSYEGLLTRPPGPIVPCGRAERVSDASFATPSGRRGALPGVRGPPGTSAGHPAGHRPCSADPASRPR
ncbi:hypothetical protein GTY67_30470 [Streptomyces sp. SID8374]|uniref:hypothetical protein n=1 Tax=Streptomyces sp. SID8374 TaxID=2690354 RepID=UPI00136FDBE3|nr:hypothetical protein [Streptomyces sp. SID8374]MYX17674.1 hypothetical protein [Streptomyces sp. SID8374]